MIDTTSCTDALSLRLRAPELADVDMMYRLENMPEVWRVSISTGPVSRQMLWDYVKSYSADIYADRQLRLIIDEGDVPVGTVDLYDFDPANARAFIGIAIEQEHQGRKLGKRALMQALDYAKHEISLHQVAALVGKSNAKSIALFKSLGFKSAGCLRSWIRRGNKYEDAMILQKML